MAKREPTEALGVVLDAGRAINTAELAEELIAAFGGSRKFAHQYHLEFEGCKAGGIARTKMLDGVLRVVTAAGSQNKGKMGAGDPTGMSDEELLAELAKLLAGRGIIHAAKEEDAGPAA
jgi:hypothetical protein